MPVPPRISGVSGHKLSFFLSSLSIFSLLPQHARPWCEGSSRGRISARTFHSIDSEFRGSSSVPCILMSRYLLIFDGRPRSVFGVDLRTSYGSWEDLISQIKATSPEQGCSSVKYRLIRYHWTRKVSSYKDLPWTDTSRGEDGSSGQECGTSVGGSLAYTSGLSSEYANSLGNRTWHNPPWCQGTLQSISQGIRR